MLLTIEHSGTEKHIEIVNRVKDLIENTFGFTVETMIGKTDSDISLYNEDMNKILSFNEPPSEEFLTFYISMSYDEEN